MGTRAVRTRAGCTRADRGLSGSFLHMMFSSSLDSSSLHSGSLDSGSLHSGSLDSGSLDSGRLYLSNLHWKTCISSLVFRQRRPRSCVEYGFGTMFFGTVYRGLNLENRFLNFKSRAGYVEQTCLNLELESSSIALRTSSFEIQKQIMFPGLSVAPSHCGFCPPPWPDTRQHRPLKLPIRCCCPPGIR
jgi:hypothetical protein